MGTCRSEAFYSPSRSAPCRSQQLSQFHKIHLRPGKKDTAVRGCKRINLCARTFMRKCMRTEEGSRAGCGKIPCRINSTQRALCIAEINRSIDDGIQRKMKTKLKSVEWMENVWNFRRAQSYRFICGRSSCLCAEKSISLTQLSRTISPEIFAEGIS